MECIVEQDPSPYRRLRLGRLDATKYLNCLFNHFLHNLTDFNLSKLLIDRQHCSALLSFSFIHQCHGNYLTHFHRPKVRCRSTTTRRKIFFIDSDRYYFVDECY